MPFASSLPMKKLGEEKGIAGSCAARQLLLPPHAARTVSVAVCRIGGWAMRVWRNASAGYHLHPKKTV